MIAGATPVWANAVNDGSSHDLHSVVDANGMPTNYPLYASPLGSAVKDQQETASCDPASTRSAMPAGVLCDNHAVNTTQPAYEPFAPGTPSRKQLPPLTNPTIGDRLGEAGVDWAWYSGGWSNADGEVGAPEWTNGSTPGTCTDPNHNTSDVYPQLPRLAVPAPPPAVQLLRELRARNAGTGAAPARRGGVHVARPGATRTCNLKPVSFVKPLG